MSLGPLQDGDWKGQLVLSLKQCRGDDTNTGSEREVNQACLFKSTVLIVCPSSAKQLRKTCEYQICRATGTRHRHNNTGTGQAPTKNKHTDIHTQAPAFTEPTETSNQRVMTEHLNVNIHSQLRSRSEHARLVSNTLTQQVFASCYSPSTSLFRLQPDRYHNSEKHNRCQHRGTSLIKVLCQPCLLLEIAVVRLRWNHSIRHEHPATGRLGFCMRRVTGAHEEMTHGRSASGHITAPPASEARQRAAQATT